MCQETTFKQHPSGIVNKKGKSNHPNWSFLLQHACVTVCGVVIPCLCVSGNFCGVGSGSGISDVQPGGDSGAALHPEAAPTILPESGKHVPHVSEWKRGRPKLGGRAG